ncbi:efflux transporter periplasmic adaptor subunit [Xanthomonas translucens pv. arrhenatheri]|uniref:Membrane fusion protein n=1 Tax=Xanthomonas graminis pv. arrhenatheri LMG 727 TaxID=1195923 RepID=A0A0K3A3S8_9XANT|nr:efflux RND transporter periplasmic adaptor subunit [Xanthomonas translucens]OAX65544.1 efflux transporter periplasmic adaptor subunit [Xanthomonas translucens pv. arrhenatheri]UKE76075.1 efflux RND transporter periplasmic adaptor subunit [Xanthomonas translucens pv. arrhenatheri]CTP91094.1 membrane fusion protein [Xanthomonas translucens pv. arrhenatheri LMG 727]
MKPSPAIVVFLCLPLVAASLSACSRDPAPPPDTPRAVKLEAVGSSDGTDGSRFVAQVRQAQRAELGFEGGGRIASIEVDVGDRVRQGQILARLDPQPTRLHVEQADANVASASADLRQQQTQLAQQQAMFEDGAASSTSLTAAKTAFASAQARLRSAQADLALARRGLRQAELRAPFDGSVVARLQQPDANVAAGQPVLQVEGQGHAQLTVALPASLASALRPGQAASAYRADAPERALPLQLRSVSDRLDGGATVQALFESGADDAVRLRSGENLLLALPRGAPRSLSVPLSALVPSMANGKPMVFVYQDSNASVRRRQIVTGNAEGDRVQVRQGLRAGERIVAAGAAFLSDGQTVVPFRPATRLSGTASP